MNAAHGHTHRGGLAYGLAAYGAWGLVPLYFKTVREVAPLEVVSHRVVWSVLLLFALLAGLRRWGELVACLRRPALLGALSVSALLIATNWFVYIYGVLTNQVLQASLGYFINPLLNVLLGLVFLRERLRPLQWAAVALAGLGVGYLVVAAGQVPWLALLLAASFALYGLVRKLTPVDGLIGVSVETLVLLPLAAGFLLYSAQQGQAAFVGGVGLTARLMVSGVVTAVPLLCFGQAARRLPLSTLGFLQYVSPTLQFLLALWVFREPFSRTHWVSFSCIWTGLFLFSLDGAMRRASASPALPPATPHRAEPGPPGAGDAVA